MALNFNQYAAEGNTFLKMYAQEIGLSENRDSAGRILMSVLHGLRAIISTEESLQFISQLPMFLKAVYVNGWSMKKEHKKVKNMTEFIDLIRTFDGNTAFYDFETDEIAEEDIKTTFELLNKYVTPGEMEDIKGELPKKLKKIISTKSFQ